MADRLERFPLFPLGIVLLPGEVIPLHIFEERYKLMIGECLERETEFGIVWLSDDGLREVGCTAAVIRLLERMPDGRMNVLVQGRHPFRLLRRIEDLPYPAGDVELLADWEADPPDPELTAETRERYAELVERATEARPTAEQLAALDAYRMAVGVEQPLAAKQALLELRTEAERVRMVRELLHSAMKRMDYAERVGERARLNGSVSPST